jgi:hypothetical protein
MDQVGLYQDLDATEWQRWNADREFNFMVEQAMWERAMAEQEAAAAAAKAASSSRSSGTITDDKKKTDDPKETSREDEIINAAVKYANDNGKVALDSRTLDGWLAANNYKGADAQLFKAALEETGSTYTPQVAPTYTTSSGNTYVGNKLVNDEDEKKKKTSSYMLSIW